MYFNLFSRRPTVIPPVAGEISGYGRFMAEISATARINGLNGING
jgi:hypothetical protein